MAVQGESEEFRQSTYKQLFCSGQEKKWWEEVMQ